MDIKLDEKTVATLLQSGKQFVIPRFQREYTWEKYNNREFFNDILGYMQVTNDKKLTERQYFLGTMLFVGDFTNQSEQTINVVDGQQRITTLTIFLSALSDRFRVLEDEGDNLSTQLFRYIMTKNVDGEDIRVLKSQSHYPFFSFYIQDRTKQNIQSPSSEEEECIEIAYKFFYNQLEEKNLRNFLSDKFGKDIIKPMTYIEILKHVRDQILACNIVSISTAEKNEANAIFEILNSKGKHLSDIDMIKNKIFEILSDTEPADVAQVYWDKIKDALASSDNGIGLNTYYLQYWATFYKRVTSKKLYESFKSISEDKEAYKAFLIDLSEKAELYEKTVNPTREKYQNKKQYYALIESLKALNDVFNVVSARVAILAMASALKEKRLTVKKYKTTVRYLENFHFAYTAMCSLRANRLDTIYSKFAIRLKSTPKGKTAEVVDKELIAPLERIWPDYKSFEEKFVNLKFSGKKELPTNLKTKYVINQINNYYEGKETPTDDGSIEHIYPESSGEESLIIGNLILLEKKLNSDAGENPYECKKQDFYIKSKYSWINNFIVENETWSIEDAKLRSCKLAELYYTKILHRRKE